MATQIDKITASSFKMGTCEEIEKLIKRQQKCFIYWGLPTDIEQGEMQFLNKVASFDNYQNPQDQIKFLFNADVKCVEKYGLDPTKRSVSICRDDLSAENSYVAPKKMSFETVVTWMTQELAKLEMRWTDRAYSVLTSMGHKGIVLMVPRFERESLTIGSRRRS